MATLLLARRGCLSSPSTGGDWGIIAHHFRATPSPACSLDPARRRPVCRIAPAATSGVKLQTFPELRCELDRDSGARPSLKSRSMVRGQMTKHRGLSILFGRWRQAPAMSQACCGGLYARRSVSIGR